VPGALEPGVAVQFGRATYQWPQVCSRVSWAESGDCRSDLGRIYGYAVMRRV
jgi:hypothetical protein